MNLLLTPDEVAQQLQISRARVYELLSEGAIESVKLGRSRRIVAEALCQYVDDLRQGELVSK